MNPKVQIVGVGMVGATLAYTLMIEKKVSKLHLVDTNEQRLEGIRDELNRVRVIRKIPMRITSSRIPTSGYDYSFICLGKRREDLTDWAMEQFNYPQCAIACEYIETGRIIVITHPVYRIVHRLRAEENLAGMNIVPAGGRIDNTPYLGTVINHLLGYTCYAIAAECADMVML